MQKVPSVYHCAKDNSRLSIVMPNLLTWDGERPVLGGLERHARALIRLAVDMGYRVDVHQNASFDWERVVDGVPVYGYGLARISPHAALQAIHRATGRVLYASLLFQPTRLKPGSVVISHGVWWEDPQGEDRRPFEMLELCRDVLEQAALVVSVDYNFLNVVRATYPRLAHKIEVIPNFVDLRLFTPPPERPEAPVTILYPRRLDTGPRGLDLFLAAAARVMARHEAVNLLLAVDQNNPAYNQQLDALLASYPARNRISVRTFDFEEISQAYRSAHVTVIPSRYSEGTSFSCLEAMACESAVVVTDVGGLTNLILDGYNGLVVPPRADSLAAAMERLVTDADVRRRLARAGRGTAAAFSLDRWRQRWARVLETHYPLEGGGTPGGYWATFVTADSYPWEPLDEDVYRALRRCLPEPSRARVLEVGSGTGKVSARLALDGALVTLLDCSPAALAQSRRHFQALGLDCSPERFVLGSALQLPFPDGSFDLVWSSGLIEHLVQAERRVAVGEMARVLRPGGTLVVMGPSARCLLYRLGKAYAERAGLWPRDLYEEPADSMAAVFEELGLETVEEYHTAFPTVVMFLDYFPNLGEFRNFVLAWYRDLPPEERVLFPGYLLVSVARKRGTLV